MNPESSPNRLIPITALRHFYELLRRFESTAFHLQAARECLRRPDQLGGLVEESHAHASLYLNAAEGFHDRESSGSFSMARTQNPVVANQLLRSLAAGDYDLPGFPQFEFDFVDHEVNPLRTTRSRFENGDSGRRSGGGGVDSLLACRSDRVPIIGEIKADTDRNPFLGLIQALTYGVEFGTVPQRARLARFYPGRFATVETSPHLDLYLLLIRYPQDREHAEFLDLTSKIAERLLVVGNPVSRLVRRIVALQTPMDPNERVRFAVAFAHGVEIISSPATL